MAVIGGIIAVLALVISFAIQSKVHKDTGVWVSRSNLRYIRRSARLKGIPEAQAYDEWMARKQKRLGVHGSLDGDLGSEIETPRRSKRGCALAATIVLAIVGGSIWRASQPTFPNVVTVDKARVNCREQADLDAAVIAKLVRNERITVVSETDGWSQVQEPSCWVRSDLLSMTD